MKVTIHVQSPEEWETVSNWAESHLDSSRVQLSGGPLEPDTSTDLSDVGPERAPDAYLQGRIIDLAPFTRRHLQSRRYRRWLNDLEITANLGMLEYLMPVSFAQLESYFAANAFSGGAVLFAVHEKKTGEFVGTAKLSHFNWVARSAELGRVIGEKAARGKGYGTEIIGLLASYSFDVLNLNRLVAGTHAENTAALKTYEKLGFTVEGRFREAWFKNGRPVDVVRVGLLRREWKNNGSGSAPEGWTGRSAR